jgi:hypothetical protein
VRGGHYRGRVSTAISASYCSTTKDWHRNILKQREEKGWDGGGKPCERKSIKATIKKKKRGLLQITSKCSFTRVRPGLPSKADCCTLNSEYCLYQQAFRQNQKVVFKQTRGSTQGVEYRVRQEKKLGFSVSCTDGALPKAICWHLMGILSDDPAHAC